MEYKQYPKANHCFLLLFVGSGYFVSFAGASSLSAASWCNFPHGHRIRWFLSSIVSLGDLPSKRSLASPIWADCSPSLLPVLTLGLHCPPWNSLCLSPDLDSPFSWTLCLAFFWFAPFLWWSTPSGSFVRWIWWYGARGHGDDGLHSRCLSLEFLWFVQVVWGTGIFWEVASPSLGLALLVSRCSSFFLYPRSFLLVFSLIPHFGRAHFPEISWERAHGRYIWGLACLKVFFFRVQTWLVIGLGLEF